MAICKFKRIKVNSVVQFNECNTVTAVDVIEGFENVADAYFRIDNYLGWASWNKI